MKEYQFYGITTAIWSCGILGATTALGGCTCALMALLNLIVMIMSKDK
jgi:hypothetical protein